MHSLGRTRRTNCRLDRGAGPAFLRIPFFARHDAIFQDLQGENVTGKLRLCRVLPLCFPAATPSPRGNSDLENIVYLPIFNGALGEIRTPDPQIRSLVLYPAELRAQISIQVIAVRFGQPSACSCITIRAMRRLRLSSPCWTAYSRPCNLEERAVLRVPPASPAIHLFPSARTEDRHESMGCFALHQVHGRERHHPRRRSAARPNWSIGTTCATAATSCMAARSWRWPTSWAG